jgi:hypothetical protein
MPGDKKGFIYIFGFPEHHKINNMFKIGLTRMVVKQRIKDQYEKDYKTLSQIPPVLYGVYETAFCGLAEKIIHDQLLYWRACVRVKSTGVEHREWFHFPSHNGLNLVRKTVEAACLLVDELYPPAAEKQ